MENPTPINSGLLQSQYEQLQRNPFWQQYVANLQDRFNQSMQVAMSKADAPEAELRVAVAIASAFRTALGLPDAIIKAAQVQEELNKPENEDDADPDL